MNRVLGVGGGRGDPIICGRAIKITWRGDAQENAIFKD